VSHVLRQLEGAAGTVGYEGLRLLSAGEAVHGLGAQGKWSHPLHLSCAVVCVSKTMSRASPVT
jgi:hypothetical protein